MEQGEVWAQKAATKSYAPPKPCRLTHVSSVLHPIKRSKLTHQSHQGLARGKGTHIPFLQGDLQQLLSLTVPLGAREA